MDRANLTDNQLNALLETCEQFGVEPNFVPTEKCVPSLNQLLTVCGELREYLDEFSDAVQEVDMALYERKMETVVSGFQKMASQYTEFIHNIEDLSLFAKNAVVAFRDMTQCGDYKMLLSDEELKTLISDNLNALDNHNDRDMSVCYNNGQFALAFSDITEGELQEPFLVQVIAAGCEQAYPCVNRHLLNLMGPVEFVDEEDLL